VVINVGRRKKREKYDTESREIEEDKR